MNDRQQIDDAFKELAELHYSEGIQGIAAVMIDKDGDVRMVQACNARASLILLGGIRFLESEFIKDLGQTKGHKKKEID